MKRAILMLALILVLIFITKQVKTEKLNIVAEINNREQTIASYQLNGDLPITIKFTHSVQKTPVVEELKFDGNEFILLRTKYQSQGVGLPFMESDGIFRQEGDFFIMDNMNRHFKDLSLRTGVGTQLTVTINDNELKLYEMFEPGTKIDLKKS